MASTSHDMLLAIDGHGREGESFFLFGVAIVLGFQCVWHCAMGIQPVITKPDKLH